MLHESGLMPDAKGEFWSLYFDDPGAKPLRLRNLISTLIEEQPPGGWIKCSANSIQDRSIAHKLIQASDRDVGAAMVVGDRRIGLAPPGSALFELKKHGLRGGFKAICDNQFSNILPSTLDANLFAFSHPTPTVIISSSNPLGERVSEIYSPPNNAGVDIGLHLFDPLLAGATAQYVDQITGIDYIGRLRARRNKAVVSKRTALFFFPRRRPNLIAKAIKKLPDQSRVLSAVTALEAGPFFRSLLDHTGARGQTQLLALCSDRHAPQVFLDNLTRAGVKAKRRNVDGAPTGAQFVLTEAQKTKSSWLGTGNVSTKSLWMDYSVLVRSDDPEMFSALEHQFRKLDRELGLRTVKDCAALDRNATETV